MPIEEKTETRTDEMVVKLRTCLTCGRVDRFIGSYCRPDPDECNDCNTKRLYAEKQEQHKYLEGAKIIDFVIDLDGLKTITLEDKDGHVIEITPEHEAYEDGDCWMEIQRWN